MVYVEYLLSLIKFLIETQHQPIKHEKVWKQRKVMRKNFAQNYKMTHSRKIPFYKPNGKQIYFDRSEIENWMKQNRVATTDEIETEAVNYIVTGKIQKGAQRGKSIH